MLLFCLLIAYPLSILPLWWLLANGYVSTETGNSFGETFYAPIAWLVESSKTFEDIFIWYLELFAPVW